MRLRPGGMDIFYVDESHDKRQYVVTAIAVPFMRPDASGWEIVWPNYLEAARLWRGKIRDAHKIPTSKELHGVNLASRRGNYKYGKRQFSADEAMDAYGYALSQLNFLPPASIITVSGDRGRTMYGAERLQRVMHALFQRMRRQCLDRQVNAMTFFDQGHPEYRTAYRKAQVRLETGQRSGPPLNLPLDMFVKDGNEKNSKLCNFLQAADLVAYAAFHKIKRESDPSEASDLKSGLFDLVPEVTRNCAISSSSPQDGILRLK